MTEIEDAIAKGKCPNCGHSLKEHGFGKKQWGNFRCCAQKPYNGMEKAKEPPLTNCLCVIQRNSPLARVMGLVKKE